MTGREYIYELEAELSKEQDEHAVWESAAHVLAMELSARVEVDDPEQHLTAKEWLGWAWKLGRDKLMKAEA